MYVCMYVCVCVYVCMCVCVYACWYACEKLILSSQLIRFTTSGPPLTNKFFIACARLCRDLSVGGHGRDVSGSIS